MRTLLTLIVLTVFAIGTSSAQVVDQAALTEMVLKGGDVAEALEQARSVDRRNLTVELRGALIARLEQLNDRVTKVTNIDQTIDSIIAPETLADLSTFVADLRDPRSIQALSKSHYGGFATVRALVDFGDRALPAVSQVVLSPSSHYSEVEHGLKTMRIMVERGKLSPTALAQIREAAKARLTGEQYFTVVWQAIDLAGT